MVKKKLTGSITLISIITMMCLFINIANTITNHNIEQNSSQIVSAFNG